MEQSRGGGNRHAIRLLGILSSGLLSILIASLFPAPGRPSLAVGFGSVLC